MDNTPATGRQRERGCSCIIDIIIQMRQWESVEATRGCLGNKKRWYCIMNQSPAAPLESCFYILQRRLSKLEIQRIINSVRNVHFHLTFLIPNKLWEPENFDGIFEFLISEIWIVILLLEAIEKFYVDKNYNWKSFKANTKLHKFI